MAAHIKKRKERNSTYYLIDGDLRVSLKTTKKTVAEQRLKLYLQGNYSTKPLPTVKGYYSKWIATKIEPLYRRAQRRDYGFHFSKHILAKWEEEDAEGQTRNFSHMRLDQITTGDLIDFRVALLNKGLKLKTVRNIIDSSFRAMYRDARAEYKTLQGYDPFLHVQWPKAQREKPDPFTAQERDRILEHWKQNNFFYYPWLFTLFHIGARPSELSALTWNDVNLESRTISITKSRYMGDDSQPKTSESNRKIKVPETIIELLKVLPSRALDIPYVFINKDGKPMNAKKWSEHNWAGPLKDLEIRHRKFYATRHTFITEQVNQGQNLLAIAQYCGTSVKMIQDDYCGTLGLAEKAESRTIFTPPSDSSKELATGSASGLSDSANLAVKNANPAGEIVVAGPGFEPGTSRL